MLVGIVSWGVSISSWGPPSIQSLLPKFPTVYSSIADQVRVMNFVIMNDILVFDLSLFFRDVASMDY